MSDFDLRKPLPTCEEMRENGGRLLVVMTLRHEYSYTEYLKTVHWQNVRAEAFERHGRRCYVGRDCDGPLNVHHLTYEHLGDEAEGDTIVLCERHHEMQHDATRHVIRAQMGGF